MPNLLQLKGFSLWESFFVTFRLRKERVWYQEVNLNNEAKSKAKQYVSKNQ